MSEGRGDLEAGLDVGERGAEGRQQEDEGRHLQWDACEGALLMKRACKTASLSEAPVAQPHTACLL